MHSGEVRCVAMSGNSRRAVSCSRWEGSLRIWSAETGKQEREELVAERIYCVSITRDGKIIVSGGWDNNMRVWNADTRKCLCTVDVGQSTWDVAISDDGKRAACRLSNSTVVLVDVEDGAVHEEYHMYGVQCVDISADGTCVVSGSSSNTLCVWDVETRRQMREIRGHTRGVYKVAISADKRRLMSASRDKNVCLWNLETSTPTDSLPTGHNMQIKWVSICPDGKFVVSCDDEKEIGLWRVESQDGPVWVPHMQNVSVVSVSACEKWTFLGTSFGRVRMWNIGQDESRFWMTETTSSWHRKLFLMKDAVDFAVSEDDGDVVLLGEDNIVRLFRPEDHQPRVLSVPGAVISSVAISSNGMILAFGSKEGNIHLWGRDRHEEVERRESLVGHTDDVSCLAFGPRSCVQIRFVSGSKDKTVRVWNISTRNQVVQFGDALVGHTDCVCCVAMSSSECYVISGSRDMTVRVWDVDSEYSEYRRSVVLRGHTGPVHSVAIDEKENRVVSGSEDKTVRVWDVARGKQIGIPLYIHLTAITDVRISNNGMCVMCRSNDGAVKWWNAESGILIGAEVGGYMGEVYEISESKDGKRLAVASRPSGKYLNWNPEGVLYSPQVRVWDLETFECIYVGEGDEWSYVSRDYLGLDVSRRDLDMQMSGCTRVSLGANHDQVDPEKDTGFRAVGRGIAFGEGSGKILANFEAAIDSFDVDHQNKVVAAGLDNGIVALLRIVE